MNTINFSEVYESNINAIVKYIAYKTNNPTIADDIASDTFTKAFENLSKFDSKKARIKTWIYTIANNCITDYYRKVSNHKTTTMGDMVDSEGNEYFQINSGIYTDSETITNEAFEYINNAFSKLSPKLREVANLYFNEELKYNEIAEILNIPLNSVKVYIMRSRKELQESLMKVRAV